MANAFPIVEEANKTWAQNYETKVERAGIQLAATLTDIPFLGDKFTV